MKAFKLTNSEGRTKNYTQWGEGIEHTATGNDRYLCSAGWIHFYTDPILAVLMNPIHARFDNPLLWECETSGDHIHEPLKSGCKTLKTIRQIPLPVITTTQRMAFAILLAKQVYKETSWNVWADRWLRGNDRTQSAALKVERVLIARIESASRTPGIDVARIATRSAYTYDRQFDATLCANKLARSIYATHVDFVLAAKQALTYN